MNKAFLEKYGPWAIITGASKGLGEEFAYQCANAGLNLVLVDIDGDLLKDREELIEKKYGVRVRSIALDLSRGDILDVIKPYTESIEVGLLVNNAGISHIRPFLKNTREELINELYVNARASMLLAHHFAGKMVLRNRGGVIFLSSMSALQGTSFLGSYAATKAYNLVLGESLWYELGIQGIDVLAFMPGSTLTPGLKEKNPKDASIVRVMGVHETVKEAMKALGKTPSIIPGRYNRFSSFFMTRFFTRRWSIKTISKIVDKVFGPIDLR
ncbi:SDR family NAD(P)-dependent oxidoreductase [Spirochaetota bacterium]